MNVRDLQKYPTPALFAALSGLTLGSSFAQYHVEEGAANDLFAANCASCHGKHLEGGTAGSLIDGIWKYGKSDPDVLQNIISNGVPDTPMVAWKKVFKDDQIRTLAIYILEQEKRTDRAALSQRLQPKDGIFRSKLQDFKLEKIVQGEGILWGFDFLPSGELVVTQRDGILWIYPPNGAGRKILGTPQVWHPGGEAGLFDVKLHPDYANNGWIYISYSEPGGRDAEGNQTAMTAIVRGRIRNDHWVDEQTIFRANRSEYTKAMHIWGSRIAFRDGYVFFSIGARVDNDAAQDLTQARGKIHRLFDDGRVPPDNPFVGTKGACPSIWSFGHRNPQGLVWRPGTAELWESEHGPRGGDEINVIKKGQNYGWPIVTFGMNYDGTLITPYTEMEGTVSPLFHWIPSIGTGGAAFCSSDKYPQWKGNLFQGAMWTEALHRLEIVDGRIASDEIVFADQGRVRYTAQGPDGYLYVSLTVGDPRVGAIWRVVPISPSTP